MSTLVMTPAEWLERTGETFDDADVLAAQKRLTEWMVASRDIMNSPDAAQRVTEVTAGIMADIGIMLAERDGLTQLPLLALDGQPGEEPGTMQVIGKNGNVNGRLITTLNEGIRHVGGGHDVLLKRGKVGNYMPDLKVPRHEGVFFSEDSGELKGEFARRIETMLEEGYDLILMVLKGLSGSGKSTLTSLIPGLAADFGIGAVTVDGDKLLGTGKNSSLTGGPLAARLIKDQFGPEIGRRFFSSRESLVAAAMEALISSDTVAGNQNAGFKVKYPAVYDKGSGVIAPGTIQTNGTAIKERVIVAEGSDVGSIMEDAMYLLSLCLGDVVLNKHSVLNGMVWAPPQVAIKRAVERSLKQVRGRKGVLNTFARASLEAGNPWRKEFILWMIAATNREIRSARRPDLVYVSAQ